MLQRNILLLKMVSTERKKAMITPPYKAFITLKKRGDQEYMLKYVTNYISSQFSQGFLAQSLEEPVCIGDYLLAGLS